MALPDLSEVLKRLNLNNAAAESVEHLPFRPSGELASSNIDRYLFRIFDGRSDGVTNENVVKSRDAFYSRPTSFVDIFDREDYGEVAEMLNRHLRWNYDQEKKDNMVSWSSSLLFALQYCLYRNTTDGTPLAQMRLCVVDTTGLPEGVFIRDLELLKAYADYNEELAYLRNLRLNKSWTRYYFGEYLSQGTLQIENHCVIVSIQRIFDAGLYSLQPGFKGFETRYASWANEVIRLRKMFDRRERLLTAIDDRSVETAMQIGGLFGSSWKLPMAAAFMALHPWREMDGPILNAMERHHFTGKLCLL